MKLLFLISGCLFFLTAKLFAQPANDDPCDAVSIPVNAGDILGQNCIPSTTYSWIGASLTGATPNPSCIATGLSNIRDVWYKLVAPPSGEIQILVKAPLAHYLVAYRPAACTATLTFNEFSCYAYPGLDSIKTMNLTSLIPSGTIYLRIMRTTEASNPNGSILICAAELLNLPVIDNSKRVGIGSSNPLAKLDVAGTVIVRDSLLVTNNIETRGHLKTKTIQISNGANDGNLLQSDASGTASWVNPSAIGAGIHYIGESYGGGKIFYVYDSGKHGLIAATTDQNAAAPAQWYNNGSFTNTSAVRDGVVAGIYNTQLIISNQGGGSYAASAAMNYKGGGFGDWYLPSKYELNLLYLQKTAVGGFAGSRYWSSTEASVNSAWDQNFSDGLQFNNVKDGIYYIRAVRAF